MRSTAMLAALTLLGAGATLAALGPMPEAAASASGVARVELRAFTNARIFDGTGAAPVSGGVIVVRNGAIEAVGPAASVPIPPGADVVDLGGRFVMPGLVNAHGHVAGDRARAVEQLDQYAYYGVTTVVSLGDDAANLRDERASPDLRRARLFVAGPNIGATSVADARQQVDRLAGMQVDWVKTRLAGQNRMSAEVYGALTEAARQRNLPVAIHVEDLEGAKQAVRGGGSLVGHSVRDRPVDAELIAMMRERDVCLVPTLTRELSTFVYAERPDFFDDPFFLERAAPPNLEGFLTPQLRAQSTSASAQYWREALPLAKENMRRLHEAGVGIAMGTDTGPTGRFQGYFEHLEMKMMVDGGMSPRDVLIASTSGAARCVGMDSEVGSLREGAWADLLVLDADPLQDIRNMRRIHSVWIAGNPVRD
jgi:imidazolonepropionase-like amidohydrolase